MEGRMAVRMGRSELVLTLSVAVVGSGSSCSVLTDFWILVLPCHALVIEVEALVSCLFPLSPQLPPPQPRGFSTVDGSTVVTSGHKRNIPVNDIATHMSID